jgi:two-component system chemotaxis sensor kinase CheA
MELAIDFEKWTGEAKHLCGPWASILAAQAVQLVKGLQMGRSAVQGLERLLQGILEASSKFQGPQTPGSSKEGTGKKSEVFLFESSSASETTTASQTSAPTEFLSVKDGDKDMFSDFLQEVPDLLGSAESNLINMSREGAWDVMKVYRPFHTLKGLFGYLGMPAMGETAHKAEALLEPYKKGEGRPTEAQRDVLLKTLDLFRRQVALIAQGLPQGNIGLCPIPDLFSESSKELHPKTASATVPITKETPAENTKEEEINTDESQDSFLRVNVARMDSLLEIVEEMAVRQNHLLEATQTSGADPALREAAEKMGLLFNDLQDKVLSLRMVPVEPLFKRLSRLVRDLSQKIGKSVQLRLEGAETELDKRLVDQLWEPAVHLIRNAMDHGLESSAERTTARKSPHGSLSIKASHLGGDFLLEIADDGRGLNLSRIAEKATRLGWITPQSSPDPHWLQNLVFRAGFSTTEKATDVSGRGVGLDVVKRRIEELKGSVRVESQESKGCRFIIRIPLTLALAEGVLLRAGQGLYLLPLTQVGRFWNFSAALAKEAKASQSTEGENSSNTSKSTFRRIDLAETFGENCDLHRQPVAIQVGSEEEPALLLADEILGKKRVVLRGLTGLMEGFPSVNGAALLSDGRVSLVLDVPSLLKAPVVAGGKS